MDAVSVRKLSKKYGDFLALDSVDLSMGEGELFALLGPNGAGKSTLMRILTTQFPPTSGTAFVMGKSIATDSSAIRRLVSYVPQEMSVWTDISGYENLLIYAKIYGMPASERKAAISEALERMELSEFANQVAGTYSGGMLRKLELACAIMLRPRILFLDEPTIGLDPVTRRSVWSRLKALNKEIGTSVFFTTHYMDEAGNYADRIGIINRGKIIKVATPEELKQSVGENCIEIEAEPLLDRKTMDALGKLEHAASVSMQGDKLRVLLRKSDESMNALMEFLLSRKIKVKRISASEPTIDDVFMKYVGEKGHEDEGRGSSQMRELKQARERIRGR